MRIILLQKPWTSLKQNIDSSILQSSYASWWQLGLQSVLNFKVTTQYTCTDSSVLIFFCLSLKDSWGLLIDNCVKQSSLAAHHPLTRLWRHHSSCNSHFIFMFELSAMIIVIKWFISCNISLMLRWWFDW